MLKLSYHSFKLPKLGNKSVEYEDAFWPYYCQKILIGHELRFAIADGATESSFSRLWAKMLVKLYCNIAAPTPKQNLVDFYQATSRLGRRWSERIFSRPLEWFALEKVQKGSFATLLGISFYSPYKNIRQRGEWSAFGIGDTCLFHIRNSCVISSFPLSHSKQFGQYPQLLSTLPTDRQGVALDLENSVMNGQWYVNDSFLLMTDALAQWFMKASEEGRQPWIDLISVINAQQTFEDLITELRDQHTIRNDDTTLLYISICDA